MDYLTGMANSPVFEFPYSGSHSSLIPYPYTNNNIDGLFSNITPPLGDLVYNQPSTFTLQCTPVINPGVGSNTSVHYVSEDIPLETILQQFGVNTSTLQSSGSTNNYYRSASLPFELGVPSTFHRPRRLVCHEVSDSEEDDYYRHLSHRRQPRSRHNRSQQPPAIHNLLGNAWNKAKGAPGRLSPSYSAPDLNSQWQRMRNSSPYQRPPSPPPPGGRVNNAWQAMRNAPSPPPMTSDQQNAVSKVWHRAEYATEQNSNILSNLFNRMRQAPGRIIEPPPPPLNREAVQGFNAVRNLPYGLNRPNPAIANTWNRAAYAADHIPPPPLNREAVQDFNAIRNLPYGLNRPNPAIANTWNRAAYAADHIPPPPLNREAVQDFNAIRNLPYGLNRPNPAIANVWNRADYAAHQIPPPLFNREAVQDFNAIRNLPYGLNQPNPAIANTWNRADYAVNHAPQPQYPSYPPQPQYPSYPPQPQYPSYPPQPQYPSYPPSSPINPAWNRMQQASPPPPNLPFPRVPFSALPRAPVATSAPGSFASLLSQAHRQHLPYAGGA